MTVTVKDYFRRILLLSSIHECSGICECKKSAKKTLYGNNGYKGSQGAILKIISTALCSHKMHFLQQFLI